MARKITSANVTRLNTLAGFALLLTLCPIGGELPPKPAGYRTAIELLDKRVQLVSPATLSVLA
jgi:hypothetical protein